MAYNLQSWQNTFANPTSNINRGILGSAFNTNPLTARGMNILGSNVAYTLPALYAYGANKLQQNLPKSLTGEGGLADQNPYYGAMGVAVEPEVEETLRYGDAVTGTNYPGANRPLPSRYQDRIMNEDLMRIQQNRGNIDNRFSFNPLNWGIAGMMKRMVEPNTPEENFGLKYFGDRNTLSSSGRTYGNQAYDVFAGKNVASAFGKGMGASAQKRIDTIGNTIQRLTDLDEEKHRQTIINLTRRKNEFEKQLNQYNQDFAGGTGGADTTITTTKPGTTGDGYTGPRTYVFDRGAFQRSGGQRASTPAGHTDPGKGSYGPWKAQGGRVGLYAGGDPEEPAEDVREIMRGENIPFSDQVEGEEGILEQLIAQYIEAGFPPDQAEAMAMQELQAMSQGSEQGIASLV